MDILRHYGADDRAYDAYLHSAFHLACESGHKGVLENLLNNDSKKCTGCFGLNEMELDSSNEENEYLELVKWNKGKDNKGKDFYELKNYYNKNSLFVATEFQQKECIEYILEQYELKHNKTMRKEFVNKPRAPPGEELNEEKRKDLEKKENEGKVLKDEEKEILKKIRGETAVFYGVKNLDVLKLLIDHGADLQVYNGERDTPLIWAVSNGNSDEDLKLCETLVDGILREFDENAKHSKEETFENDVTVNAALLKLINYVNAPFVYKPTKPPGEAPVGSLWFQRKELADEKTALMKAAELGHYKIVELLMDKFKGYLDLSCHLKSFIDLHWEGELKTT